MITQKITPSRETKWLMPVVDILLALAAFMLAYYVRYSLQLIRPVFEQNTAPFDPYIPYMGVFAVWLYIVYNGSGLYRTVRGRAWIEEVYVILNGATNATLIIMALSFVLQPFVFSRLMLLYVAVITVILLSVTRIIQRLLRASLRARGVGIERVLIIGMDGVGQAVLRTVLARKDLGLVAVGYVDDDPSRGEADLGRVLGLGKIQNLAQIIQEKQVQMVIITLRWHEHDRIYQIVRECQIAGADVRVVPDIFQLNLKQVQIENLDGIPLLGTSPEPRLNVRERLLKRLIDVLIILIASPILLFLFGIIAIAIRIEGRGPIFYSAVRVGENGKLFKMIKFRSMIPDAEKYRKTLVETNELDPRHPKILNDPRITRVGNIIRKTSLDELPNLINVLRGQMSLVGPRPPTPDEVELYDEWHKQRLKTMPGITGLWQISGRSDVPFDEMCLLDIYYIENWSLGLDIQILLMTLPRVLLRQGAY
ncbi:MAG: sugar transferase [Phototrophicales bacterium]|nr:sugar transferase [Phototrophicales bacterium]